MTSSNEIKVGYIDRDGYRTTAYIDPDTGLGTNKHSEVPLQLRFDRDKDCWVQIDTWQWRWNRRTEDFERADEEEEER